MRIYPNKSQQILIIKTFGCCRFVYNNSLEYRKEKYDKGYTISKNDLVKRIAALKKDKTWLSEVDSIALQSSVEALEEGYRSFFRGDGSFPVFKKKGNSGSYTSKNVNNSIRVNGRYIKIPKIGWVKTKHSDNMEGKIKRATIVKEPDGKFYVSLILECASRKELEKTGKEIGIDAGLKTLLVFSNGDVKNPLSFLNKSLDNLASEYEILSRKQHGSKNYERQRLRVARLHKKIANRRKDAFHKLSLEIVKNYDFIAIETLDIKHMQDRKNIQFMTRVQKTAMNRNIADASWGLLYDMIRYKAQWYGKTVYAIDTYEASSQTCHVCGYVHKDVKNLNIRNWICPNCGTHHDRDINAAINILNIAKRDFENGIEDGYIRRRDRKRNKSHKKERQKEKEISF